MSGDLIEQLRQEISVHKANAAYREMGYQPLFSASPESRVVIVGQAPGVQAQAKGRPWDDASGIKLMSWLGVTEDQFRSEGLFAHIPMDFYYPGKGVSGDLPPRKDFAPLWHSRLQDLMPKVQLTILVGRYSQQHYLKGNKHRTLTDTVRNYKDFLPDYFPLVHPSPLNFRWFSRNRWFESDVLPDLARIVGKIIDK